MPQKHYNHILVDDESYGELMIRKQKRLDKGEKVTINELIKELLTKRKG